MENCKHGTATGAYCQQCLDERPPCSGCEDLHTRLSTLLKASEWMDKALEEKLKQAEFETTKMIAKAELERLDKEALEEKLKEANEIIEAKFSQVKTLTEENKLLQAMLEKMVGALEKCSNVLSGYMFSATEDDEYNNDDVIECKDLSDSLLDEYQAMKKGA